MITIYYVRTYRPDGKRADNLTRTYARLNVAVAGALSYLLRHPRDGRTAQITTKTKLILTLRQTNEAGWRYQQYLAKG